MDGADEQLEKLVQGYAHVVRAAVAKVSRRRDPDLGDEVLQRVAEALWRQLQRGEQTIEQPASYLYRCAIRETIRLLRREAAEGPVELDPISPIADDGPGPEDALRARRLHEATDAALAELPPDRAAAARAHLAGFAVEEIMRLHGWPYQKARNLIARGMADLRGALQRRGFP